MRASFMDAFFLCLYLGMKNICVILLSVLAFVVNAQQDSVWTYKIGVFGVAQKDIYPLSNNNTSKFNLTWGLPSFSFIGPRGNEQRIEVLKLEMAKNDISGGDYMFRAIIGEESKRSLRLNYSYNLKFTKWDRIHIYGGLGTKTVLQNSYFNYFTSSTYNNSELYYNQTLDLIYSTSFSLNKKVEVFARGGFTFGVFGITSRKTENPIVRERSQRVTSIDFDAYPYDWYAQFGIAIKI